jgi:uncharacterized protein (TIGR03083 family)
VNAEGQDDIHANPHARDWYLEHLLSDLDRFAAAVRRGPLDAAISGCPGWDLRRLTAHQGVIHRWARHCAANAAPPESRDEYEPDADLDADALAAWLVEGGRALVDVLGTIDLDGPTWHPFPVPKLGRLWPRRQAQETSVHRWDAEHAIGDASPIDPALASDGIDEYLNIVMRRLVTRESVTLPAGSLHLHCTDTHGEWLVSLDEEYQLTRAHAKGAAALRGPAEALQLRLWNRDTDRADELSPVGDESVLEAWLALSTR